MGYSARIICDSLTASGHRLTTMEITLPRIVLAEFNTHRTFSRNSASSRAIPVEKRIAAVEADPFIPESFGKNQRGMQAAANLGVEDSERALRVWQDAASAAIKQARALAHLEVHKQLANRLLEPFLWQTVLVTATEWSNYFALRCNPEAQPEIRKVSEMMRAAYEESVPMQLSEDEWHLPLISDMVQLLADGFSLEEIIKISVGRCCRVSYLTHDGKRDPRADIDLCDRLLKSGHMSPFEHVARPANQLERECFRQFTVTFSNGQTLHRVALPKFSVPNFPEVWSQIKIGPNSEHSVIQVKETYFCGNYDGWVQARKCIQGEDNFGSASSTERKLIL